MAAFMDPEPGAEGGEAGRVAVGAWREEEEEEEDATVSESCLPTRD